MSRLAPLELRLHLGGLAVVAEREVGGLLGIADDDLERLLDRVPPRAREARGGRLYLYHDLIDGLRPAPKPTPAPRAIPIAETPTYVPRARRPGGS